MAKAGLLFSRLFSLYLCSAFVSFKPGKSSHIVGWANFNFVSHNRLLWKLGKELQTRGHNYTQILPNCTKETYDDIHVKMFNLSITNKEIEDMLLFFQKMGETTSISGMFGFARSAGLYTSLTKRFCEDFLKHEPLIVELKKSVDLVLCDMTNICCYILTDMLNATRVDVSPIGFGGNFGAYLLGYPLAYLSLEWLSESSDTGKFSFTNRLVSFLHHAAWQEGIKITILHDLWEMYAKANSRYTNALDAWRTQSIALISHDFSLEYSRPLRANIKVIGPLLPEPPRELQHHLNEFMSKNDKVVLVSFSTIISNFPRNLAQVIAEGLSKLSVAVLWRYSGDIPINVGKNVKIVSWMPQNDVLGHPSTKIFVTHGGVNSIQESVYHSVPMVVIPWFVDQFRNARLVKQKGLGVVLDANFMEPKDLTNAIHDVLNNKLYCKNANAISAIMKDRKQTPSEEGADWIEYALRHDGTPHLTSEALYLPEYKLYMFDVFLFLLIVVTVILFMFARLCFCVCRRNNIISVKQKEA